MLGRLNNINNNNLSRQVRNLLKVALTYRIGAQAVYALIKVIYP